MRIISLNVNGLRAAIKKGLLTWLETTAADVICLQETKWQMGNEFPSTVGLSGYYHYHVDAIKPGYSGVAIYTRQKPTQVKKQLGFTVADEEGRYLQVDFGSLSVVSVYLPSGSSGPERQALKFTFMEKFLPLLQNIARGKQQYIICGDWNIVHREIDIENWKSNQKNSGCLPEERAWLDKLFSELSLVDAFRVVNQEAHQYTWWSNRGQAWAKNVGWRIDYQIISKSLEKAVRQAAIYKDQRFSDHAPLMIDYAVDITDF